MKRTMLALAAVVAAAGLAGCVAPDTGPVAIPPQPKTAPESPLISTECRSALAPVEHGADLLNVADLALAADAAGAWLPEFTAAQTHDDLVALRYGADALGVTGCDSIVTLP